MALEARTLVLVGDLGTHWARWRTRVNVCTQAAKTEDVVIEANRSVQVFDGDPDVMSPGAGHGLVDTVPTAPEAPATLVNWIEETVQAS